MFNAALSLDPSFALALAYRTYVKFHAWFFGWNSDPDALDLAIRDAEASVAQDPDLAMGHTYLGWMHMWKDGHERSLSEHERALALDPNSSDAQLFYSSSLIFSGQPELAEAPMLTARTAWIRTSRLRPYSTTSMCTSRWGGTRKPSVIGMSYWKRHPTFPSLMCTTQEVRSAAPREPSGSYRRRCRRTLHRRQSMQEQ